MTHSHACASCSRNAIHSTPRPTRRSKPRRRVRKPWLRKSPSLRKRARVGKDAALLDAETPRSFEQRLIVPDKEEEVKPKKPRAPRKKKVADEALPTADTDETDAAPVKGGALVIVESPTKAKTIGKYLGKGYTVKATVGHLRDLPRRELGVDVENNFAPKYVTIKEKAKTLAEIKKAAKYADRVLLATDPDREGEAIAWHVASQLNGDGGKIRRVLFHEITKDAVAEALSNPLDIDQRKVDAQQARRVLDRLVGYKASPVLWKSIKTGLSAGRVQTVALRLIIEREEEIRKFVPQEYWTVAA